MDSTLEEGRKNERMKQNVETFIEGLLTRDQANRNIVKIISYTSVPAAKEGSNYLSVVIRTAVTVLRQSGRKEKVSLIVKTKPTGEGHEAFLKETGAFKKEIMVYLHVLEAMDNMMGEYDDTDGKLWCNMIGYVPYDCIVFEDLGVRGYRLTNSRHDFLDLDHSLIVMQSMGRLHALSKVLITKSLIDQRDFSPHFLASNAITLETVMAHTLKLFGKRVKTWGKEWENVGDTFIKYSSKIKEEMIRVGAVPEMSNLIVMNHGDVWTCNLLFKYPRYSEKPIDMRFIDFQLSHYNTAGWDLTYFLHGSVNPEVRRNHYDLLLQIYVHEMKKVLAIYGLPPEDVATVEDLKADMDRLLPFRLIVSFFFRSVFVSKYPFDLEAAITNFELNDAIGLDARSIDDPNYKDNSTADLKTLASELDGHV